jgi:hypothetical protein
MLPTHHVLSAAIAAMPLRRAGWSSLDLGVFAAGAVLIDVDHYLSYAWHTGDLSLLRAYRHHRAQAKTPPRVYRLAISWHLPFWGGYNRPFHAAPPLAGVALAALRWPLLRPLVAGLLLHRVLDMVWESFWRAQWHAHNADLARKQQSE